MRRSEPLLEASDIVVHFPAVGGGLFDRKRRMVHAVNGVSIELLPGETLGLVGESGSGKSTLARAIMRLGELTAGTVRFQGEDIAGTNARGVAMLRRGAAMVFQDPYGALNPRMNVGDAIGEVLRVHGIVPAVEVQTRVNELLDVVGLDRGLASRRPGDLSGGQCQRVGIARALAIEPRMIVADECVAALDVSIQGQIINLLIELREKMGLAMIFIAHDLSIVRRLCDRVAVMYLGRIVEQGPTEDIFGNPRHPYTASLISSIPDIDPDKPLLHQPLEGDLPSPLALPSGCPFHPRCPIAQPSCSVGAPPPLLGRQGHRTACAVQQSALHTGMRWKSA